MRDVLRNLLQRKRQDPLPTIPQGQRVYAVGDIHGRLDLLDALIAAVEADDSGRPPAETTIILLGDLVDRGAQSAGVVARARELQARRNVRILAGNHEEMFVRSFDELEMLRAFLRFGGRETVLSYGVDPTGLAKAELSQAQQMMREAVPEEDIAFIRSFEDWIEIGDYLFVHAGIAPGIALADQRPQDLRWIREPFLSHTEPHRHVVVHGHTICDNPQDCGNRIGIDTGAFRSGKLTALVLEGTERRYIETAMRGDRIIAAHRPIAV